MASKGGKRTVNPASTRTLPRAGTAAAPAVRLMAAPVEPIELEPEVADATPMVPFAQPEAAQPGIEALIEAAQAHAAEPAQAHTATAAQPAEDVVETAEAVTTTAADTIADTTQKEDTIMATNFENTTSNVSPLFGDMNDRAKSAMEKTGKMAEQMTEFAKGNVEALVESSRIAAKGFESLGQEAAEFGRKSFETATANFKTLATVKSPTEFFKLQSDFMRQSFDSFVAEASKGTETMLKLAGDAAQPLSNRVAVAADKVKTAA